MIICFACSSETRHQLDTLRQREGHSSYQDVIQHAVALYHDLASQIGDTGVLVLPEPTEARAVASEPQVATTESPPGIGVPEIFSLSPRGNGPSASGVTRAEAGVTVKQWIFGQYNKLLPMKAGLRAMASLIAHSGATIDPTQDLEEASVAAAGLAEHLRAKDERCELNRDEYLATGFPSREADSSSLRRFRTQFMFDVSGAGRLHGLPAEYGLLGFASDGLEDGICLTEAGWTFCQMPNPVLDDEGESCERFSPEEIAFLTEHIEGNVPAERAAFWAVAEGVEAGADTPTDLDHYILAMLPPAREKDPTHSFLSTQRSGVVSRLGDLGLIARKRKGVRVQYVITESGSDLLAAISS